MCQQSVKQKNKPEMARDKSVSLRVTTASTQNLTFASQLPTDPFLHHFLGLQKIISRLQAVPLKQLKRFPGTVTWIMVLATGVVAVVFIAVVIHDRDLLQAAFQHLEVVSEERLEILILHKAQIREIWR